MIRTQIYLTDNQHQKLRMLMRDTGKSQSELIREAIDQFIKTIDLKNTKLSYFRAAKGLWADRTDFQDIAIKSPNVVIGGKHCKP